MADGWLGPEARSGSRIDHRPASERPVPVPDRRFVTRTLTRVQGSSGRILSADPAVKNVTRCRRGNTDRRIRVTRSTGAENNAPSRIAETTVSSGYVARIYEREYSRSQSATVATVARVAYLFPFAL